MHMYTCICIYININWCEFSCYESSVCVCLFVCVFACEYKYINQVET